MIALAYMAYLIARGRDEFPDIQALRPKHGWS